MRNSVVAVLLACVISPDLQQLIDRLEASANSGAYIVAAGVDTNKALLILAKEIVKQECKDAK